MTDNTFAALPPLPTCLLIGGESLDILPLKVGELPSFLRAVRPFAQQIGPDVDWLTLFGERGDDVMVALAVAVRRPRDWVAALPIDEAIRLAEAVVEVNADFFIRQVTPALLRLAGRIGDMGVTDQGVTDGVATDGAKFSAASSPTGTATPTS